MRSLLRDPVAAAALALLPPLVLACFPGAIVPASLLGHGPNDVFVLGADEWLVPAGPGTRVETQQGGSTLFVLGADGALGRDFFLRLLYGGRHTLLAAALGAAGAL